MGLFGKKNEESKACCCGGNCTPEKMAQAEAAKDASGVKVLGSGCAKCNALEAAAKEALAELPFPVLSAEIAQRVVFAESAASGQTVLEREPKGIAAAEVAAFIREIQKVAA